MKKYLSMLLIVTLSIFLLIACSSSEKSNSQATATKQTQNDKKSKDNQTVKVDKGLLTVKVTIPKSLLKGQDDKPINMDQITAEAKKSGIEKVINNNDESITYVMSKATHKKLQNEYKNELLKGIDDIKNSGKYKSIKDIKYNDTFSKFTMIVDEAKYKNSFDGVAGWGLAVTGMMYQLFNGAKPDDYKVTIDIQNQSGKVIDTAIFPDAFKNMNNN